MLKHRAYLGSRTSHSISYAVILLYGYLSVIEVLHTLQGVLPIWCQVFYNVLAHRYGDLYTAKNVAISGTHTHSGPGGYLQYVLYIITSLGFVRQSFYALVDGIENSIIQAHNNLRPGFIYINQGNSNSSSI